ncbi:hypothetical protein ABIF91_009748 [Bradyrhizobium sp. USDA 241]
MTRGGGIGQSNWDVLWSFTHALILSLWPAEFCAFFSAQAPFYALGGAPSAAFRCSSRASMLAMTSAKVGGVPKIIADIRS